MAYKGVYIPVNPLKWRVCKKGLGAGKLVYRSLWEKKLMIWCDNNKSVVECAAEPFAIPYISPLDNKKHRYYIDMFIALEIEGVVHKKLIEVKPHAECHPPKQTKTNRQTHRYKKQCATYVVNQAKWKAAREFCRVNGLEFIVMDEYSLGIKKRKAAKK